MYKNTNCFHLAIPCGDLEIAKKFYSETLGCRLDNSAQEWADVDFWGNELTLHKSDHKLDNERHVFRYQVYDHFYEVLIHCPKNQHQPILVLSYLTCILRSHYKTSWLSLNLHKV